MVQHQNSAAAQQQRVSDTTTGREVEGRSAHAVETEAAVVSVGRRSTAGAQGVERPHGGHTNRNLHTRCWSGVQQVQRGPAVETAVC